MTPWNATFHPSTAISLLGAALLAAPGTPYADPPAPTTETCESPHCPPPCASTPFVHSLIEDLAPLLAPPPPPPADGGIRPRRPPLQATAGRAAVRITTPNAAGVHLFLRTESREPAVQLGRHELMIPVDHEVPAGRIELCARGHYHESRCIVVDLDDGERFEQTWHLDLLPAHVRLPALPAGSHILLDGLQVGTAPVEDPIDVPARAPARLMIVTPDDTQYAVYIDDLDPGEVHTLRWSDVVE